MEEDVCRAQISLPSRPSHAAWCPVSNLIAIASSAQQHACFKVLLLEPGCPEECFALEVPASGPEDELVCVQWSPAGYRRALLTVSRLGGSFVWTQTPHEDSDSIRVRALNKWYGHALTASPSAPAPPAARAVPSVSGAASTMNLAAAPTAAAAAAPTADAGAPGTAVAAAAAGADEAAAGGSAQPAAAAPILHAQWLCALPSKQWSSTALGQAEVGKDFFDLLFYNDRHVTGNAPYHWLRTGQLAAAIVTAAGTVQLWWTVMGRYANQLSWCCSEQIPISNEPISAAHACAGPCNSVRLALVHASNPATVHVVQLSGNPAVQAQPQRLQLSAVASIPLPDPQLHVSCLVLQPAAAGACLWVCAGPAPDAVQPDASAIGGHAAASCQLYVFAAAAAAAVADPMSGSSEAADGMMSAPWQLLHALNVGAPHVAAGPDPSPVGNLHGPHVNLSGDVSKVAVVLGALVRVLDSETFTELAAIDAAAKLQQLVQQQQQQQQQAPADLVACFSPNSCCLCFAAAVTAVPVTQPKHLQHQVPYPATANITSHPLPSTHLTSSEHPGITSNGDTHTLNQDHHHHHHHRRHHRSSSPLPVCMLHVLTLPDLPAGSPMMDGFEAQQQQQQQQQLQTKMDALRLAWCLLQGHHPWDVAQRIAAFGAETQWGSAVQTLNLFDVMLHTQEYQPRPKYCVLADRLKLAVLRQVPGRLPALLTCDLIGRNTMSMLQSLFQGSLDSSDGSKAVRMLPDDVAALQPWLNWCCDYFVLYLASLKRWLANRRTDETFEADLLPCIRLLLDGHFARRLFTIGQLWLQVKVKLHAGEAEQESSPLDSQQLLLIKGIMQLTTQLLKQDERTRTPEAVQAEMTRDLGQASRMLFRGLFHLHYARANPNTSPATLATLLAAPAFASVPDLSGDELMHRAQELGLMYHDDPGGPASCHTVQVQLAWRRFRAPSPDPSLHPMVFQHTSALLQDADWAVEGAMAGPAAAQQAGGTAQLHSAAGLLPSAVATAAAAAAAAAQAGADAKQAGTASANGVADTAATAEDLQDAGQHSLKRKRWHLQLAAALAPGGAAATAGSRAAAAAARLGLPVLDVLSGRRIGWGLGWFESADGMHATMELDEAVLEAQPQPSSMRLLRRAWVVACPLTGEMWKRVTPAPLFA